MKLIEAFNGSGIPLLVSQVQASAGMTGWGPIAGLVWCLGGGIKSITSRLIVGAGGVKLSMVEVEQVHTGDL